MLGYVIVGLIAAGTAALATPVVRALACRLGAVDAPGGRRIHEGYVPRLGGLAVLAGFLAALVAGWVGGFGVLDRLLQHGWDPGRLLLGAVLVTALGAADDVWRLRPWPKLAVQMLAAMLAILGGVTIQAVTEPLSGRLVTFGPLGGMVTLLWIVGITNAFNLIDGLDGLAAGVGVIASVTIGVLALVQERPDVTLLSTALAGALVGFLLHNFHPASVFLGDAGAFLIGYTTAILSIHGLQKGPTLAVLLVPILALGFPIVETLVTIGRRLLHPDSPGVFTPDREHIHHRVARRVKTQREAVLILYAVSAVLGTLACVAVVVGGPGSAVVAVLAGIAVYVGLRNLGYVG